MGKCGENESMTVKIVPLYGKIKILKCPCSPPLCSVLTQVPKLKSVKISKMCLRCQKSKGLLGVRVRAFVRNYFKFKFDS